MNSVRVEALLEESFVPLAKSICARQGSVVQPLARRQELLTCVTKHDPYSTRRLPDRSALMFLCKTAAR